MSYSRTASTPSNPRAARTTLARVSTGARAQRASVALDATGRGSRRLEGPELRQLVADACAGDERSWRRLVEGLSPLVLSVTRAHRLSPADAADVCQETWCALVANIGSLREPERLAAWLATTARRESLRALARAQRQIPRGDDLPEPEVQDTSPVDDLLLRERDAALWSALGLLRPSDQTLLRLLMADPAGDEEPSYREIADQLGVPVGSVGPTRGRALERLRWALGDAEAVRPIAA